MKTTRMLSRLLVGTAIVGVIGGAAMAARIPMALQDTFDYTDTSADETSLALAMVGGELVFQVGEQVDTSLPPVIIGGAPRFDDASDVPSDQFLAGQLDGIDLDVRADTLYAATFSHDAASLADVVSAYVEQLTQLGFTADLVSQDGNVVVYQFVKDTGALRGVFTATATGANAHLAAVL